MKPTIDQQIECVTREIRRRKKAFPKLVEKEFLTETEAVAEMACMQAVFETLTQLRGLVTKTEAA